MNERFESAMWFLSDKWRHTMILVLAWTAGSLDAIGFLGLGSSSPEMHWERRVGLQAGVFMTYVVGCRVQWLCTDPRTVARDHFAHDRRSDRSVGPRAAGGGRVTVR